MNPPSTLPPGFVHVDVDGLWTLAICYGFPEGGLFTNDLIFERGLPRLAELFAEFEIPATFFFVGRDLELPAKAAAARALVDAGHEPANHGWSHRLDLEDQAAEVVKDEIARTHQAIERATGRRALGFRAPGYAAGERIWTAASRAGLCYDGSVLPTIWGPALRWLAGRLRAQVRREMMKKFSDSNTSAIAAGMQTDRQYRGGGSMTPDWFYPDDGGPALLRLPLAVSPVLRIPLQASMGMLMGAAAVRAGLRRLARRGMPVTFLLHGLDAVGAEELEGRLPAALLQTRAFQIKLEDKLAFLRELLTALKTWTEIQLSGDWVQRQTPPERPQDHGN